MTATLIHLEIEPDGAAALEFERRLSPLGPTTVGRHGRWCVEIDAGEALSEIHGVVAGWLRELGRPETTIRVDGHGHRVEAEARMPFRRHHALNEMLIG